MAKACTMTALARETVIADARREAPRECCGVLLGRGEMILEAVPVRNIAEAPDRFLLDPEQHIRIRREARARGLEVVGFYHSHPHSPPIPSPTDLAEATYPECLYAIVGLVGGAPAVRVFAWRAGEFEELEVRSGGGWLTKAVPYAAGAAASAFLSSAFGWWLDSRVGVIRMLLVVATIALVASASSHEPWALARRLLVGAMVGTTAVLLFFGLGTVWPIVLAIAAALLAAAIAMGTSFGIGLRRTVAVLWRTRR